MICSVQILTTFMFNVTCSRLVYKITFQEKGLHDNVTMNNDWSNALIFTINALTYALKLTTTPL